MCGETVSEAENTTGTDTPMDIDEAAIRKRFNQFRTAWTEKASMKSRSATYMLFTKFLQSRSKSTTSRIEDTQPKDVVEFLCWLDSCGARRRAVVHARHCAAVGMKDFTGCSTTLEECSLRYAFDSLRSNHISKLAMVFEKELGIVTPWSSTLRIGNPVRSELVTQYLTFTTEEQKHAGVLVKQAPAILHGHSETIVRSMRTKLQSTVSMIERVTLARDIAFLAVAFSTTKKGAELTNTLIKRFCLVRGYVSHAYSVLLCVGAFACLLAFFCSIRILVARPRSLCRIYYYTPTPYTYKDCVQPARDPRGELCSPT